MRESRLALETVDLPGGAPQIGEPLDRAGAREVLEETGYHVFPTDVAFAAERRHDRWSAPSLEICFYAELLSAVRHQPVSNDGAQVAEWLPMDSAEVTMHLPHTLFLSTGARGRFILAGERDLAKE